MRALLPILDDFERALKTETADQEYAKGMELIYQRLFDSLKKLGLEPVVSAGQPFDPHVHHAVEMVETEELPDHTVLDEYPARLQFQGPPAASGHGKSRRRARLQKNIETADRNLKADAVRIVADRG